MSNLEAYQKLLGLLPEPRLFVLREAVHDRVKDKRCEELLQRLLEEAELQHAELQEEHRVLGNQRRGLGAHQRSLRVEEVLHILNEEGVECREEDVEVDGLQDLLLLSLYQSASWL